MDGRVVAIVSGEVQGVGYRCAVQRLAGRFNVRGTVCNLPDGYVEIRAEGDQKALRLFLEAIRMDDGNIRVEKIDIVWGKPRNEFDGFKIIRSGR